MENSTRTYPRARDPPNGVQEDERGAPTARPIHPVHGAGAEWIGVSYERGYDQAPDNVTFAMVELSHSVPRGK